MAFWKIAAGGMNPVAASSLTGTIADISGNLPMERITGQKTWRRVSPSSSDLPQTMAEITGLRFQVDTGYASGGLLLVSFRSQVKHRGIEVDPGGPLEGGQYPIGIALRMAYRQAASQGGLSGASSVYLNGGGAGQNIRDIVDHYGLLVNPRIAVALTQRYAQFEVWGTGHTDAGPADGLAELDGNDVDSDGFSSTWEFYPGRSLASAL